MTASHRDDAINRRAVELHRHYHGKIQTLPRCPLASTEDLSLWYTPGVAAVSRAIATAPERVFELTDKGNSVAVLSDGSRVLGLGNIGPEAGLPVMEGKALLFKYFGAVDAIPICVDVHDVDAIVSVAKALAPSFGGINLEDIATPQCFPILDRLRCEIALPVWHDDQQGTAVVTLAGLLNALEVVGKQLEDVRIALIGIGAANMACYRILRAEGVAAEQILACDSVGLLHAGRDDIDPVPTPEKRAVAEATNPERISGGIEAALRGADVCLAFSQPGPNTISSEAVAAMATDAIVFACANPVPEIWPDAARAAGARIVATGRSDFSNQVNNLLAFPGVFRGALDVRATAITDGMARAAAHALAELGRAVGLDENHILPPADAPDIAPTLAAATGMCAQIDGVARLTATRESLFEEAMVRIAAVRRATQILMRAGVIAAQPD